MTTRAVRQAAAWRRHAHQIEHDAAPSVDAGVRADAAARAEELRRRADEADPS